MGNASQPRRHRRKLKAEVSNALLRAFLYVRENLPCELKICGYPFNPDNAVCHPKYRPMLLSRCYEELSEIGENLDECTILTTVLNFRKAGKIPRQ